MTSATTYTAIYQSGYAIFGVGRTFAEALIDANEWVSEPLTEGDLGDRRTHGEMCEIEITEALYNAVKERGGNIKIEDIGTRTRPLYDVAP